MELISRKTSGGRYWYAYCKYWDGTQRKRVQRATGIRDDGSTQSRQTAEIIGYQIERSLAAGGEASARPSKTLRQALRALTEAQELARKSDASLEIIADKGLNLAKFFGNDCVMHSITKERLRDYAVEARSKRSVPSVSRELLVFRQACKAIGLEPPESPDIGEPSPPPQRTLDTSEQMQLLAAVPHKRKIIIRAYLQLGLRQQELWKIDEVDWPGRYLHVNGTKTKKANRWIPIPDELYEEMLPYRANWSGFEKWTKIDRDLRIAAFRAGLICCGRNRRGGLIVAPHHEESRHDLSCNDLRGTYAHFMAVSGVPQLLLAKLMGTSVKMLDEVYARLDKRGDHQREAVERGAPRLRLVKRSFREA
jgi:integrase